jgi:hydroxypyruvate isomerase
LVLLGLDPGDAASGERGYLNRPGGAIGARSRENSDTALRLAVRLGCPLIHVLVGNERQDEPRETQIALVEERLRWMAPLAAESGVTLVVEVMNPFDGPLCLLTSTREVLGSLDALVLVRGAKCPYLRASLPPKR